MNDNHLGSEYTSPGHLWPKYLCAISPDKTGTTYTSGTGKVSAMKGFVPADKSTFASCIEGILLSPGNVV